MILVVVEVVHSRLAPSPALDELLGIPANGFFESPVRGWATYYRRICVRPWTCRNSLSWLVLTAGVLAPWRVWRHG
jgi:hypothetical protein